MVVYFESAPARGTKYTLFQNENKQEIEQLLQHGFSSDVWFHLEKLGSAHVYLRLEDGQGLDDIPSAVLEDCAQLVKASSVPGSKRDNVQVLYTLWSNLKKNGPTSTDGVGFKSDAPDAVRRVHVKTRNEAVLGRLDKTRRQKRPDLEAEKIRHEKDLRKKYGDEHRQRQKEDLEASRQYKQLAEQKSRGYSDLFSEDAMQQSSNENRGSDWEDDFM